MHFVSIGKLLTVTVKFWPEKSEKVSKIKDKKKTI